MNTKIFWILTAILALCGLTAFAHFANFFNNYTTPKPPTYWDESGNFVYTGALHSTLSGSEVFFTDAIRVENIKTLISTPEQKPRFYIEYPHFSEMQNITILTKIRDKIISLPSVTGSGEIQKYTADFSLYNGNNLGSVHYNIHELDEENFIKKTFTENIFVKASNQIYLPKDLWNAKTPEKTQKIKTILETKFQEKYPNEILQTEEIRKNNFENFSKNPQFSFSGTEVIFDLDENFFTENSIKNLSLNVQYSDVEGIILLAPPPKEIPKNTKNTGKSSDGKKYVALTFDDGPHRTQTPRLLDILKEKNVTATFFVLGKNIGGNEAILVRMTEENHEIANHSWSHPQLTKYSRANVEKEIQNTNAEILRASGQESKLFRPPYGAYTTATLKAGNVPFIMWSVDSFDWKHRNVAKNLKTTMNQLHDGAIILYHDIHKESVDTIPSLIEAIRAEWYEFLSVSELYQKYYNEQELLPEQVCFSMQRCQ